MGVKHVAIILDGNRRFARARGMLEFQGHQEGAKALERLLAWGAKLQGEEKDSYWIEQLSLFAFSMQNFNRSEAEKAFLMKIFEDSFTSLTNSKDVQRLGLRVDFLGRLELLSKGVQRAIAVAREKTRNNSGFKLNFCVAYGGREEIIDAINRMLKDGVKHPINEEIFSNFLYMKDEPEIIIRTGDVTRTSNFLPWQSTYSEWFFLKKTWPEFTPDDFKQVIDEFQTRERRFGK